MNYPICDKITWKESLLLLKNDLYAQRVYSTVWKMTKDVLYLSLTLCSVGSLTILVPAVMNPLDTWWETLCIVFLVPISVILPLIWVCAYFGWYKNIKKINSILLHFINSLPGVDSVAQYMPVAYTFRYEHQQFHAVFQEKDNPGKPVTVAQGKLMLALIYTDTQERDIQKLFEDIEGYLKGKETGDFAISGRALLYRFPIKPLPTPQEVNEAMNLMLYLAQRFNLKLLPEEEVYGVGASS